MVGGAIVIASLVSVTLLFLLEITSKAENPYLGILTYIIFPAILIFGIVVVILGTILERRRRRKMSPDEVAAYPKLDLNDKRARKVLFTFLLIVFVFICASGFGSYKAFEYTESVSFCGQSCHVMKPERVAYASGAHARVECVACHVGSGASWYVKSKINGAHQLYALAFNTYSRPIPTPVHNLRPATDTCEHCHWPQKFYGSQLKVFNRYAYDEQNSLRQTRMLMNVGGGSPVTGLVAGIHWHMNVANEVTYVSTDDRRQVIPWVRSKDKQGNVTEYFDRNRPLSADQIANGNKRRMDCVDCHNRPAHTYLPPDVAVDQSFSSGRLDKSIPYLKRESVELLSKPYNTTEEARSSIANGLKDFYRTKYAEVYTGKQPQLDSAVVELQRIFETYFFPEMKTDWQAHPNNIGHLYSSGCFRCHDGDHVSNTGKVISNDCTICHTVIYDSARPPEKNASIGAFQHPVDLGGLAGRKCQSCHSADKPFQHPVNLGDISMFQCVECHPK
jgi:nitrate/TMAO reductase-like tetraheme cytochrome c subunit